MTDITVKKTVGKTKNIFHITWKSKPLPKIIYIVIKKWVKESADYSALDKRKLLKLKADIYKLNKKYNTNARLDQVLSARQQLIKGKIMSNHSRMNGLILEITAMYKTRDIIALAHEFDFPPLSLLRGILLQLGYSPQKLHDVFVNKSKAADVLRDRDLQQYELASNNDAESYFNIEQTRKVAQQNEHKFVKYLLNLGINLQTEDELVEEQTVKHGRAIITPDVLFIDEVYINNIRTYWIDYKDYIGINVRFLIKSNKKQAAKYNKKWGPGAMCYRYSYFDNVKIKSTIILDGKIIYS